MLGVCTFDITLCNTRALFKHDLSLPTDTSACTTPYFQYKCPSPNSWYDVL